MTFSRGFCVLLLPVLLCSCRVEPEPVAPPSGGWTDIGPVPFRIQTARLPFDGGDGTPGATLFHSVDLLVDLGIVVFRGSRALPESPFCDVTRVIPADEMAALVSELQGLHRCEERSSPEIACAPVLPWSERFVEGEGQRFDFGDECQRVRYCDSLKLLRVVNRLVPHLTDAPAECDAPIGIDP